jgi:DNA (cytosine-5)-methyltransferase 1
VLNAKDYGVPQNRERIFMVSILDCEQAYYFPTPVELTKRLKDVMEKEVEERYYLKADALEGYKPSEKQDDTVVLGWSRSQDGKGEVISRHPVKVANCVTAGKRDNTQNYVVEPKIDVLGEIHPGQNGTIYGTDGGSPTICAGEGVKCNTKIAEPMIGAFRGRNPENPSERGRSNGMYKQRLEINENGTSNTLTGVQKDNVVLIPEATKDGYIPMEFGGVCDLSYPNSDTRRGRVQEGGTVAPTLTCGVENSLRRIEYGYRIRKLTERECFRLMDMPEEYIDRIQAAGISRSQQYKMAGNSIVVACMYHIWRKLFIDTEIKTLTLF